MATRQQAISGGRWTAASSALAAILQLLQTAALARLLIPEEFGLMAVTMTVVTILSLVANLGLSQALVHYDDVSKEDLSSLYWLNLLFAIVLMALLFLLAPLAATAFNSPLLTPVLQISSLIFPLSALGQQLSALAQKDLNFSSLAHIEVGAAMTGLGAAVITAVAGGGVYALVAGILARAAAGSLLAWLVLPATYRPTLYFRGSDTRRYVRYGSYVIGESLVNAVRRESDVFIGGLVLGPAAMGLYSVPRNLGLRLAMIINPIVTRVGFPVMSRIKDDRNRLKSIYMQTLRMTASVNFPIYIAIGVFAPEIVALLYGPKWHDSAIYLRVFAAWGLLRSTGNPAGSLLYAVGMTQRAFWWNLGLLALLPLLFWAITLGYGLLGLAVGMSVIQLCLIPFAWKILIQPACGARLSEFLKQFITPLWIAAVAGTLAWLVTHNMPQGTLRLAAGGMVGGFVYLGFSWLFNKQWANAMQELLSIKLRSTMIR